VEFSCQRLTLFFSLQELVVDAFPICFLSLVYQNVVPTVVTQLEGDREKITKSLVIGTSVPLIMFLAWNAVILGNIVNLPDAVQTGLDPISFLRNEGVGGELLSKLVTVFSELAITTSLIGFIYGLLDALTDVSKLPLNGPEFNRWKPVLFAGVLLPPFLFSLGNPDIFYEALEYGGAFGVSTLFLVLPPIMAWQQRYGENKSELTVPPMVPFGKIPLGSLWKAAGTLILEQGADKLGVFDFFKELFAKQGWFS
jgi:Amino acid permeases